MVSWFNKNLGTVLVIFAVTDLYLGLLTVVEPAMLYTLVATGVITLALLVVQALRHRAEVRSFLTGRAAGYGANLTFLVLAGLGILVVVNLVSYRHHKRFDLTAGGQYTLAPQTRQILQGLKREVRMTVFMRQNDPASEKLRRSLEEYVFNSRNLRVTYVDPDKQPRLAESFLNRFGTFDYGTVFVESGDQTAQFKGIGDKDFLTGTPVTAKEEEITNALVKVLQDRKRKLGFLTGHGERAVESEEPAGYKTAGEAVSRYNTEVVGVNLASSAAIPADLDALVVAGPKTPVLEPEKNAIRSYVAKGGRLFLMIDPMDNPGLDDMLASWGVTLRDNLVVTDDDLLRLMGSDPFVTVGIAEPGHPVTRDFANLNTYYPLARSVELASTLPEGTEGKVLVRSVPKSWADTDYKSDSVAFDEGKDLNGPVPIAVALTVRSTTPPSVPFGAPSAAPSAAPSGASGSGGGSAGQAPSGAGGTPSAPPGGMTANQMAGLKASWPAREARVVVFGDSDFASNSWFHTGGDANGNMFINVVNWLAEQSDLVAITPRTRASRTLQLTAQQSELAFLLAFFLLPLAVLIAGVAVWRRRRRL